MSLVQLRAQDLNPTVEVSRQYEGRLMEVHKPSMKMALPDSVDKFNLEFDYSVFDSPFRSSYEFSPAVLNINLASGAQKHQKLYLKAGAGFSLHPELDVVWTPVHKEGFSLSVYGSHRSYIGRYRSLYLPDQQGNLYVPSLSDLGTQLTVEPDGNMYSGWDMFSKAGVSMTYDWKKGGLYFDAGYHGIHLKDTLVNRSYDGIDIKAGVFSKGDHEGRLIYKADIAYKFAEDKLRQAAYLGEHDLDVRLRLGKTFKEHNTFLADAELALASYSGAFDATVGSIALIPKYIWNKGRWDIEAGLKLAFLFKSHQQTAMWANFGNGQIFYPDVKLSFNAIKNYLDIYAVAEGGPDINKYSSLLAANHHLTPLYNPAEIPLLDNTDERVSVAVGLKGNIASRFSYNLRAGYELFENLPLPMIYITPAGWRAGLGYESCQNFYTRFDFKWKSQDVDVDGYMKYTASDVDSVSPYLFAPAAFTGYIKAIYNWNRRIFFGFDCGFSTGRKTASYNNDNSLNPTGIKVPGYADLGMYLEVAVTRKLSFWGRGGNMLNQTIQKTPLYAESGMYFTVGICLNL